MESVNHKYLKDGAIESRIYQETILGTALKKNTLVVLPTGLGKTFVAAMLAAKRVEENPRYKVLFLAPTKPLVVQHCETWKDVFEIENDEFQVFTGETPPKKREKTYKDPQFIFATPQVIQNDILADRYPLDETSLLIVDEAHRASGNYPYGFIAKKFVEQATEPRILGLTASPGSSKGDIERVCNELYIEDIESRSRENEEVKKYIKKREFNWVKVELPKDFVRIKSLLEAVMKDHLRFLKQGEIIKSSAIGKIRKKKMLKLQSELVRKAQNNSDFYKYISAVAAVLKIHHALELLETQGVKPLCKYFKKLDRDKSKAAGNILNNHDFGKARRIAETLKEKKIEHPKVDKMLELVESVDRAIVFANYRSSVDTIIKRLEKAGIKAIRLVGQAKGGEDGLTQKEQVKRLDDFRNGKYDVLVATSIGEEGLDIPEVDLVVFYEPVPSAIRSIQRAGRTARHSPGAVKVLMTKGTRDEAYYWASFYRERNMEKALKKINLGKVQRTLDKFSGNKKKKSKKEKNKDNSKESAFEKKDKDEKLVVFADTRESGSGILRELNENGLEIRIKQLDVADFQISDRVAVERKTTRDFVKSLVDGRLFKQAPSFSEMFEKPLIIVEGEELYNHGKIHPNSIRGALSSLVLDFGLPIIYTKDMKETASFIELLAKREQLDEKREVVLRSGKRPKTKEEMKQYIVESLPNVGPRMAKKLLKNFGSVKEIFNASETQLKKIDNVGDKKAGRIKKVIEEKYEE
ncbi:MAG: DEAD/DEAH box helicase [Candidatus Undinarchaeales archaeon]